MLRHALTAMAIASSASPVHAAPPLAIAVDVSHGREVRMDRLLGGNIAVWYQKEQMVSQSLKDHFADWKPGLLRLPGGSWSDELIWNGNGVRHGDTIDSSKCVNGIWKIDYSGYAPGFRLKANPDKAGAVMLNDYHGNLDMRALHDYARDRKAGAIVTVNAGTGTPEMAAEWLKWTRREGYDVAYWEVGNELDGEWELGHIQPGGKRLDADAYASRFKEFAKALKAVDPAAKVGGPTCSNDKLMFVETLIREAGDTLDFVSFHTYPVLANNSTEAQRFAQADDVREAVAKIRGWIKQYHPGRVGKIEIGVSEWHKQVAETRSTVDLSSGLWSCLFIGALADSGVAFANLWDCFSQTETGGHGLFDSKNYTPRASFHALTLWSNHMHSSWLKTTGGDESLHAFATRGKDRVSVMLVNTSPDEARQVSINLGGKAATGTVRAVRLSEREYFWNPHANAPLWSLPPSEIYLTSDAAGNFTIPAFCTMVLEFSDTPVKQTDTMPTGEAELALILPEKTSADLPAEGFVAVREKGGKNPWRGTLPAVSLKASGPATLDRAKITTSSAVGTFFIRPTAAGKCTVTASAGDLTATASFEITPVKERREILWSFSDAGSIKGMESSYRLAVDEQVRPNQAVAAITLDAAVSIPQKNTLLGISKIPDSLDRKRVGGVVALAGVSPGFKCDDPGASVEVVLQSNSDHWIPLGSVKLSELASGKKEIAFRKTDPVFFEAMAQLYAVRFMLNTSKPVTGVVHLDDIGFILRSE